MNISGIHLIIQFENPEQLTKTIDTINSSGLPVSAIWLNGKTEVLKTFQPDIQNILSNFNGDLFINYEPELIQSLKISGCVLTDSDQIQSVKEKHPDLKTAIITDDLAECKNAELFGADLVYLGPYQDIGMNPYQTISPKEHEYEWMILDLTIPLFAFGEFTTELLNNLTDKVKLNGILTPSESIHSLVDSEPIFSE